MAGHARKTIGLVLSSLTLVTVGLAGWLALAGGANEDPHDLTALAAGPMCRECHRNAPGAAPESSTRTVLPNLDDFVKDPVAMCVACHKDDQGAHPVGAAPDYPVPADLPLDAEGRVSCLTCHYVHGSLVSNHQCCSASLLDRMFSRDRLRKSFLLRRDNPRGELCKVCHEATIQKEEAQP